ncbi:hypothetical protein JHS3_07320 [Jeongeupia sp. HS-3]|uniref:PD-(D/E)XK nuclease family protein n=1 Tax=Jeongeupia sp. HS-3 TaxID=1009682 RepID=UPI0018A65942|nr:PD-(D/E)XK nuclease family protein [Jeongeupia sp. HS-3]BCL74996.1 hypothetical protein JHS3_07320 [Jeongeupia sp. HS-3]
MPELASLPTISLADIAAPNAVLLTVNNRLARRLTTAFAADVASAGLSVAEVPQILPVSAWLNQLTDALAFTAALPQFALDPFAAKVLWTDVIVAEEGERGLMNVGQAAALAQDADKLVADWRVQVDEHDENDEYKRFLRWQARYHQQLGRLDADDDVRRSAQIIAAIESGELPVPDTLVLAGFREVSPRLAALFAALTARGTVLLQLADDASRGDVQRYPAADRSAEWRAAAAWAVERLSENPHRHYAILAPKLENDAPFARRVLLDALGDAGGFNVAIGRPLAVWPLARAALAWLGLLLGNAPWTPRDVGAALLAGYCAGDPHENGERAALDAKWRKGGVLRLPTGLLDKGLQTCPSLSAAWQAARALAQSWPRRASLPVWAERLRELLALIGFPGARSLDSVEYQTFEAFKGQLSRLAMLAPVAGDTDARHALTLFTQLLRDAAFQPERSPSSRLDVLGLLEAEGGRWDGVWMLGLTDDVLPAMSRPNPLIPMAALRSANAPRATPERELAYAKDLFAALQMCAPQLIVSHAELEGERELRPSPLIADLSGSDWQPAARTDLAPAALETQIDDQGPPLQAKDWVGGGVTVLDTQAKNPQWAFVKHRLGASALPAYTEQIVANVRGNFLHAVMEVLWRSLGDSETLNEMLADARIGVMLELALGEAASAELRDLPEAIRTLEIDRARLVVREWLEIEARRTPFAVTEIEKRHDWRHGPLSLAVRLDRVDTLADGGMVVVDYKTGKRLDIGGWGRERPTDLQLPFYASLVAGGASIQPAGGVSNQPVGGASDQPAGAAVAGLFLAKLNAREVAALGLAESPLALDGVATPGELDDKNPLAGMAWADVLDLWRMRIGALADEFIAGRAANVSERPDDLKYCDALPFLRLNLETDDETEA